MKSVAGRPVPFNIKRLPKPQITRLSRRVGLRTIPSLGGKVVVCPCDRADGFETGDKADFWEVVVGDPYVIQTTHKHCGDYGAYTEGGNANGVWKHSLSGTGTKWFKWHFMIVPNPDEPPTGVSSDKLMEIQFENGNGAHWSMAIYIVTGGATSPRLSIHGDWPDEADGTHALESNQYYCVKLKLTTDGSNVTAEIYVDDELDCSLVMPAAGYDTFYYFLLDLVQWTFQMDCRTALDCWCEVDSDIEPACDLPSVCWAT